jgi:hypothetical protein
MVRASDATGKPVITRIVLGEINWLGGLGAADGGIDQAKLKASAFLQRTRGTRESTAAAERRSET